MKRTFAIVVILALAAGAALFCTRKSDTSPFGGGGPEPDIILVTIDTLRIDALSRNNHGEGGKSKTPFLDQMASEGIYFEHAHAHNVVTFPSHTNILTGLLPYQHGVRDNAGFTLDPKHQTVAPLLKAHGYATGAFVAAYPLDARFGLTPGFDVYDDKYPEGSAPKAFVVPERKAVEVFAAAQKWYDSVVDQKKFMWVHIYEPHQPYKPDSPWKEQYANPYYGEVAEADDVLGKFLRPILARRPNTMVIITGDHGEGMGEHGEITHGLFAYEETLAIPLILWEKGRIAPKVETRYVGHRDIVPTILDRVGIEKPAELTGMSLVRLDDKPRPSYFEALTASLNLGWAPLVGMISEGHKYIDLPLAELYDLDHDRVEKHNILTEDRRTTNRIRELLAAASPMQNVGDRNITKEESSNLRSLGYLTGTAAAKKVYTAADDPKNLVHVFSAIHRAVDEYQHGKVQDALHRAQKIVHDRPEMSMARDFLAFMYQETDDPAAAEKVLRDSIAGDVANDTMKQRLGLMLSENGRAAEAVQELAQYAPKSTNPDLLNAYGIALADLGRLEEAMHQFQRVLTIDATNATAYQNMGVVALRAGDAAAAQQYLIHALQLNKDLPLALNTLGVVYARAGNFPLALDAWKRAVTADPKQYDALYNIGLVEGRAGNRLEARRALAQFVQTAPPKKYGADIATARRALVALQ